MSPINSIYDAYCLLVDENVLDFIVEQTNSFANLTYNEIQASNSNHLKVAPENQRWHDLTRGELKVYIGVRLYMAANPVNQVF